MSQGLGARLSRALAAPVDGASLAVFRIAFGAILFWEIADYHRHGWIARYWIDPVWHFPYWGFGWVRPWPGAGMYLHFAALAALALCVAAGLAYRAAAALFCAGFTWVFLIDQARYMNHLYLVCLLSGLMAVVPANATWSLDARRKAARASAQRAEGERSAGPRWLRGPRSGILPTCTPQPKPPCARDPFGARWPRASGSPRSRSRAPRPRARSSTRTRSAACARSTPPTA